MICMTMNTTQTRSTTGPAAQNAEPDQTETITKLRAEIGELNERLRLGDAHDAVVREFAAAGARSPELLFGSVRERLQFADDGTVANAAALVDVLKREMPEQFGTAASIDAAGGAAAAARPLSKEALSKMSPEQIAKLDWNAVRAVLSQS